MQLFIKLRWYFRKEWRKYLGSIILLLTIALLQLIPPYIVGIIIDTVENKKITNNIVILLGLIVFISIIIYGLRYFWRILLFSASYQLAIDLRNKVYQIFSKQVSSYYLYHRTGDLITRATNDIDKIVFAAGEGVLTLVDSLVIGSSVILVMSLKINWQLTIITMIPMLLILICVRKYNKVLYNCFLETQQSFSNFNSYVRDNLNNIHMIKSFGLEEYQITYLSKIISVISNKNMILKKLDTRFEFTLYLMITISNLFAIGHGSWLVHNNVITIGHLTSFIMYLGLMIWPTLALGLMFNIVERGHASYNRLLQIFNEHTKITGNKIIILNKKNILKIKIQKFVYPNHKKTILKNVHAMLFPGYMLGLCGPNGSGKSTLIALILRYFDVKYGDILFNNTSIKKLLINHWRNELAVISQIPYLFSDSIANNIALGKPDATLEQIKKAAKLACIHEDIIKLSKGYNTKIGSYGLLLSGGQKQRIVIARALILKRQILLIDDALSAIDNETKYKIMQNLHVWRKERTVIISAHQLSILKYANEILVLDHGHIHQRGNHQQLMNQIGWYNKMYFYQN